MKKVIMDLRSVIVGQTKQVFEILRSPMIFQLEEKFSFCQMQVVIVLR